MVQAICGTLIHSFWQGLLFAIVSGLVMAATRRSSAAIRYNMLCSLFFLFLSGCVCTFFWECNEQEHGVIGLYSGIPFVAKTFLSFAAANDYFSAHASLIVTLWFIVLSARCIRMWASVTYIQKVKRHRTNPPPSIWTDRLNSFCEQWRISRPVLLLESGITKIPLVIGHLRPVIFVPLGLLTGLPQAEIEAVLWHELAHIRRRDYLVNFLQNIAESLFFFNPGLIWMSSLLREERENCCDDMAIAQTKDRAQFVRALVSFREHAAKNGYDALNGHDYATAFATRKHKLLRRAMRIIYNENSSLNAAEKIFLFVSCFFLAFLLLVAPASKKPFKWEAIQHVVAPVMPMEADKPERVRPLAQTLKTSGIEKKAQVGKDQVRVEGDKIRAEKGQEENKKEQTLIQNKKTEQSEEAALAALDKNRMETMRDLKEAETDKRQAETDKIRAETDNIQAEKDRLQAWKNAKTAEKDKTRADLQRQQTVRDL